MSKRPTFTLDSPTFSGESPQNPIGSPSDKINKNPEIISREWLCQVLASNKLTSAELALLGFLYGRSCGFRYAVSKLRRDLATELDMKEEAISRLIKGLSQKNLVLVSKRQTSAGLKNVFYVSRTYPEDFFKEKYSFSRSNYPFLWEEVESVFNDAVIDNKIVTYRGVICENNAAIGNNSVTEYVTKLLPIRNEIVTHTPRSDSINTELFAAPSILSLVFIEKYSFLINRRIRSARNKRAILDGLDRLINLHGQDVIEERLGILYAEKGDSVVKPNFHKYLEANLEWYETQRTLDKRAERLKYLENLARELFQPIHEGFYEAQRSEREIRPNFGVSVEATARAIGFNFQSHYDTFRRAAGDAAVMRGISNEFTNRILAHYQKHTLPHQGG